MFWTFCMWASFQKIAYRSIFADDVKAADIGRCRAEKRKVARFMKMFLFEGKTFLIGSMQWRCSVTICFLHIFQKKRNSWQINLPAQTEEAVCSSTARLRWSTSVCVLRSDGYTFVNFFGCVRAGGSISGDVVMFRSAFLSAVCFGSCWYGSWECRGVHFWNRFRLCM